MSVSEKNGLSSPLVGGYASRLWYNGDMKSRGFEIAKGWEDRDIRLPRRSTAHAAGYDIEAGADVLVPCFRPGIAPTLIPTGLKAYCQPDECYFVFNRSSGAGKGLVLANGVGVIDADYYGNPTNDGHFGVLVFNVSDHDLQIKKATVSPRSSFRSSCLLMTTRPPARAWEASAPPTCPLRTAPLLRPRPTKIQEVADQATKCSAT